MKINLINNSLYTKTSKTTKQNNPIGFERKIKHNPANIVKSVQKALEEENEEKAARILNYFWQDNKNGQEILKRHGFQLTDTKIKTGGEEYFYKFPYDEDTNLLINSSSLAYQNKNDVFQITFNKNEQTSLKRYKDDNFEIYKTAKSAQEKLENGSMEESGKILLDFYNKNKKKRPFLDIQTENGYLSMKRGKIGIVFGSKDYYKNTSSIFIEVDRFGKIASTETKNIKLDNLFCYHTYARPY